VPRSAHWPVEEGRIRPEQHTANETELQHEQLQGQGNNRKETAYRHGGGAVWTALGTVKFVQVSPGLAVQAGSRQAGQPGVGALRQRRPQLVIAHRDGHLRS